MQDNHRLDFNRSPKATTQFMKPFLLVLTGIAIPLLLIGPEMLFLSPY